MSKFLDFEAFMKAAKVNFNPLNNTKNSEICIKNDDVIYTIKFHNLQNGMIYCQSEIAVNAEFRLIETFDERYNFLYFNTENNTPLCKSGAKNIHFDPNQVWIGVMDRNFLGQMRYLKSQKPYKTTSIMFDENLIKEFEEFKHLEPICDNFFVKKEQMNKNQALILNELKNCEIYCGKMREIFIESKVLELVLKSFNAPVSHTNSVIAHKAKEILLSNIINPPSIAKLAKICATNPTTLKNDFKKCFKTSIYGFLQNERLNLAKDFLKAQDINVSEAARLVGYNSLSHFTKIFKAKFSILPAKFIKDKKIYC